MTRLRNLRSGVARVIGATVILLLALSIFAFPAPEPHPQVAVPVTESDAGLYRSISENVRAGQPYYEAMADAHRAKGYPLKPIMTVRLPTLAWISAMTGPSATQGLIMAIAILTLVVWFGRLRARHPVYVTTAAILMMTLSIMPITVSPLPLFHESWAGLLVALSLGLWRKEAPWMAVTIALIAALFRESVVPLLAMMAFFAAASKRWRETMAWGAALAIWCVAYASHYGAVGALINSDDLVSPGWGTMAGWPLFVGAVVKSTPLSFLPLVFAGPLTVLSLLGWASLSGGLGLRVAGWLFGMSALIMLFARPDNFYWALLPAPLILAGLAFIPSAMADLWRSARVFERRLDLTSA